MDGGHRLSEAYLAGHNEVLAVQFDQLPEPDDVMPGEFVSLSSARLKLREVSSHDLDALFDLYSRPETSEFESWSPHQSISDFRDLLQYWIDESYKVPRWEYALAIEYDTQLIGLC